MMDLGELWGGVVDSVSIDLVQQQARIEVTVVEAGTTRRHRLAIEGVTRFEYENSVPGPWTYVELTEATAETTSTGVRLTAVFWLEGSTLVIEGESMTYETGSGRFDATLTS